MQDDDDFRVVTDPTEIALFEEAEAEWYRQHPGAREREALLLASIEPEPVPTHFTEEEIREWQKTFRKKRRLK